MNPEFQFDPPKVKKNPARSPVELPPVKEHQKEFAASLDEYTVEYLRNVYKSLIGKTYTAKKAELIKMLTESLLFSTEESFQQWFGYLPSLTQTVLSKLMFTDFLPISVLEDELKEKILVRDNRYSWDTHLRLNEKLNLDFLTLDYYNQQFFCGLPEFLRKSLSVWFVQPPEANIANCASCDTNPGWDNSQLIADSFPLLCDAVHQMFADVSESEKARAAKGFKKRQIAELRAASGFLDFNMDRAYCPDCMDLALRFMLCMKDFKPVRPEDAHDDIRDMVTGFFDKNSLYTIYWDPPDRNHIEATVCIDHLSKSPGYYLDNYKGTLPSRETFRKILLEIAKDGRRYDVDKLAEHIRVTSKKFAFSGADFERSLRIRASSLEFGGITYSCDEYEGIRVKGIFRHHLLVKPLFKAYCYIFAALGLLEITQETPPLPLTKIKNKFPISPYDSLKTIRITKFGLWCLGLSKERPPKPHHEYQAIADKELLLVTVQGDSLERTVYLNKIGIKLGEDRWRISPASFISGCESKKHIEDRINRFKALIDPAPAAHWIELFDNASSRAGLFGRYLNDMLVYNLPENRKITEELLRDPELKSIAFRAEGGMLIVPAKNQKKFLALLNEHGIAGF